jgi:hypothetical protein
MAKSPNDPRSRGGKQAQARLRWLLKFGALDPASLNADQRRAVLREARAFVFLQHLDPARRERMRSWPVPSAALGDIEVWSAQRWLKRGLELLRRSEKWIFTSRVKYELDAYKGLFWARLTANSRVELFKALAYDALRDARFGFRFCPECRRPFAPVRRQAYCSPGCSQAVRTRK